MDMQTVNCLMDSHAAADGPTRELILIGRLLIHCMGATDGEPPPCPEWRRGCQRFDLEEWIEIMIRPAGRCDCWPI